MIKRTDLNKILVIGSGPFVVGQSSEFDYLGTEVVRTLAEAGYQVILLNSNPATSMTEKYENVSVYLEPVSEKFLTEIIRKELPDAILANVGGQTTINLLKQLRQNGLLDQLGIRLLGTDLTHRTPASDITLFQDLMKKLAVPTVDSVIVRQETDLKATVSRLNWPIMVRPVDSIGGTGGGLAKNQRQLQALFQRAQAISPLKAVACSQSIVGTQEIEFEVLRDRQDHVAAIFNCEQFNQVGVHAGDSIALAPIQTLSNREIETLRQLSLRLVRELKIVGSCNLQFAFDKQTGRYWLIKMTPRLGRTSAFAAKATGYPLAKVASLLALGLSLDEIDHPYEKGATALVEPAFDYIAAKFPGWQFDRISGADRTLGMEMKATGEVLVFERNLEAIFLRGLRSLSPRFTHIEKATISALSDDELTARLIHPTDEELFCLAEALRRGYTVDDLSHISKINPFFISKIAHIIKLEQTLKTHKADLHSLRQAKKYGFSDDKIGELWDITAIQLQKLRQETHITPGFQEINSLATNPLVKSQQFFLTYGTENEAKNDPTKARLLIVGAGLTKVGQGSEVDNETVLGLKELRELGFATILVNNNLDAYSTSRNIADRLYYAPINVAAIQAIAAVERPTYVITQLGGKSASKLTSGLEQAGLPILGASGQALDQAHEPQKVQKLLKRLNLQGPRIQQLDRADYQKQADWQLQLPFPILIHPNPQHRFVPTEVLNDQDEFAHYLAHFSRDAANFPFTLREFLRGDKYEVDGIFDGEQVLITGILEHLEHSSLHSGDAMTLAPAKNLSAPKLAEIRQVFLDVGTHLKTRGFMNIRFLVKDDQLYVLAIDLKGSRNLAFINKITQAPIIALGVQVLMGAKLKNLGYHHNEVLKPRHVHVKIPVYSFTKLNRRKKLAKTQMKTTGEAIGSDITFEKALYKALEAARQPLPEYGRVLFSIASQDLEVGLSIAKRFKQLGYQIVATSKTATYFQKAGLITDLVHDIGARQPNIADEVSQEQVQLVINTAEWRGPVSLAGALLREVAVMHHVPLITTIEEAEAILTVLESRAFAIEPLS